MMTFQRNPKAGFRFLMFHVWRFDYSDRLCSVGILFTIVHHQVYTVGWWLSLRIEWGWGLFHISLVYRVGHLSVFGHARRSIYRLTSHGGRHRRRVNGSDRHIHIRTLTQAGAHTYWLLVRIAKQSPVLYSETTNSPF